MTFLKRESGYRHGKNWSSAGKRGWMPIPNRNVIHHIQLFIEVYYIKTVIVIGGGIAGLAAAIRLAEQGYKIKLIEKRPVLGGRASSFTDPDTGEPVDNCQHVLMKCCTNLLDFYQRLGVENHIHWFDRFHFIRIDNEISEIYASHLPAPFHLLPSFLKLSALSLRDKFGDRLRFFLYASTR